MLSVASCEQTVLARASAGRCSRASTSPREPTQPEWRPNGRSGPDGRFVDRDDRSGFGCRIHAVSGRPLMPWAMTLSKTVRTMVDKHGLHPGVVDGELLDDQQAEDHRGETSGTEPSDEEGGGAAEPGSDHAQRHRDHPHDGQAEHGVQGDAPVDDAPARRAGAPRRTRTRRRAPGPGRSAREARWPLRRPRRCRPGTRCRRRRRPRSS